MIHQGTEQEDIFQFSRFHRKRGGCTRIDSEMPKNQAHESYECFKTNIFQSKI